MEDKKDMSEQEFEELSEEDKWLLKKEIISFPNYPLSGIKKMYDFDKLLSLIYSLAIKEENKND